MKWLDESVNFKRKHLNFRFLVFRSRQKEENIVIYRSNFWEVFIMKEIKLKELIFKRNEISATVDEKNVEFKNGVALVRASVVVDHLGNLTTYQCYGLIDENFQEVYSISSTDSPSEFSAKENLMFFPKNTLSLRIGDNDFIVKTVCRISGLFAEVYEHVHIDENGKPIKISSDLGIPKKTKYDNLVILSMGNGYMLYDINKGSVVTPRLYSIKESETDEQTFDVVEKIALNDKENGFGFVDYLSFKIDGKGNLVTAVLSSLESAYLDVPNGVTVEEFLRMRREELEERRNQFREELLEFRKSPIGIGQLYGKLVIKKVRKNDK